MKTPYLYATVALCMLTPLSAEAADTAADFVRKASIANEFEIESSKLALDKSQDKDIKLFARQMVRDHTKMGDSLEMALQSSQTGLKTESTLDAKHQQLMNELERATTDNFNRIYVQDQEAGHKEVDALFAGYAAHGDNKALQTFASTMLPTIREHSTEIEDIIKKQSASH